MQKSASIDTWSLAFLLSLIETRSVAESADVFGMSPATAQRTLAKLRAHFDDPLFTRSGFVMRPTARAERIAAHLGPLLAELKRLGTEAEPDYAGQGRTVRIAAYDNACVSVFAPVFPALCARAPKVRLEFMQADERMFEALRSGVLDFVIYARQGLAADLRSMPLLTTPYVWVARRGHPLERTAAEHGFVTPAEAEAFPQIIANAQPDRRRPPNGPAEGWFHPKHGPAPVMTLPFFAAAPVFLEQTDALSLLPRALADLTLDRRRFSLLPTPAEAPTLTTRLVWCVERDADPYWQWLRGLLKHLLSQANVRADADE